jgi:hypothetical protein
MQSHFSLEKARTGFQRKGGFILYYAQIPGEHAGEGLYLFAAGEQGEFSGFGLA